MQSDLQEIEKELREQLAEEITTLQSGLIQNPDCFGVGQIQGAFNIFRVRVDGIIDRVIHDRVGA
jgi:hypothetical protein